MTMSKELKQLEKQYYEDLDRIKRYEYIEEHITAINYQKTNVPISYEEAIFWKALNEMTDGKKAITIRREREKEIFIRLFEIRCKSEKYKELFIVEDEESFTKLKETITTKTGEKTIKKYGDFYRLLYNFINTYGKLPNISQNRSNKISDYLEISISHIDQIREKRNTRRQKKEIEAEKRQRLIEQKELREKYTPIVWANIAHEYHVKHRENKKLPNGNKFCEKLYEKLEIKKPNFTTFYGYFRDNDYGDKYSNINNFNDLEKFID